MTASWAFTPRARVTAVRGQTVTDGPFVDSRQVVACVYILDAPDLDAALATVANPVLRQGGCWCLRTGSVSAPLKVLQIAHRGDYPLTPVDYLWRATRSA